MNVQLLESVSVVRQKSCLNCAHYTGTQLKVRDNNPCQLCYFVVGTQFSPKVEELLVEEAKDATSI